MDAVERPRVVCLCGSLRFQSLFQAERRRLTSRGVIVLGPDAISGELTPSMRAALGELHLRRIDPADEVRVVSEDGDVGSATCREHEYAGEAQGHQFGSADSRPVMTHRAGSANDGFVASVRNPGPNARGRYETMRTRVT